jgi:glutamate-1-semialdehyde 2,1-aminomutase
MNPVVILPGSAGRFYTAFPMTTLTRAAVPSAADRALGIFPAGSNGEFNLPPDMAVVIESGRGCMLRTADGHDMLDFSMGWGSVLPGHAHPEIVAAVTARAPLGSNFSCVNVESLKLAEEITRVSPACERLRFCASGTEATMHCIRLARAFTGKSVILKFEGAYHGSNDEGVTSLFPSGRTPLPKPEPSSAGVGHAVLEHTLIAPFNDASAATALIREHAGRLGGVIVEPLHRCFAPAPGFLESLRDACTSARVPLIFDEVVTGFRMAYGGAQEKYGVIPDLVAYGKALGGGYPIGAFGGKAEILDRVREDRLGSAEYVWTASTLGGNPVSCAAASAALDIYRKPDTYTRLFALGEYLRDGMRRVTSSRGIPAHILGDGPLAQIAFIDGPVHNSRSLLKADRARARTTMLGLFQRGVFLNPMGTKLYLSLAHEESHIDEFCRRLAATLDS